MLSFVYQRGTLFGRGSFFGGGASPFPPLGYPSSEISGGPIGQLGGGSIRGWVTHTKGLFFGGPNHEPDPDPDGPTPGGGVDGISPISQFYRKTTIVLIPISIIKIFVPSSLPSS